MASVDLRPGDTLNMICASVQETPFGRQEVEASFSFSYDDLLVKLKAKGRDQKSRKSANEGARFSRLVSLSSNALKKGKWATGADIDKDEVFTRLLSKLKSLDSSEVSNLTANATFSLRELCASKRILKLEQVQALRDALVALDLLA